MERNELDRLTNWIKKKFPEVEFSPIRTLTVTRGRVSPYIRLHMIHDNLAIPTHKRIFSRTVPAKDIPHARDLCAAYIKDWQKSLLAYEADKPVNMLRFKVLCDRALEEAVHGYVSSREDGQLRIMDWAMVSIDEDLGILSASIFFSDGSEETPQMIEDRDFVEVWSSENTIREAVRLIDRLIELHEHNLQAMADIEAELDESDDEDEDIEDEE